MFRQSLALVILVVPALAAGTTTTRTVCPAADQRRSCGYIGNDGIQQAVDAAANGDTIFIRAGTYAPDTVRDITFEKLVIRGFIVVDGKDVEIRGEPGTVLDGSRGKPATAIVMRGGRVAIRNLAVRDFRVEEPEDDIYDGHGLFFIDTRGTVEDVTIEKVSKMALTVRGAGGVLARRLRILDGHVGIWLEETAHIDLSEALVRNNASAGICAYMKSTARISKSVFESNHDDGVYATQDAIIELRDSTVKDNSPLDIHAEEHGRITVAPQARPVSK